MPMPVNPVPLREDFLEVARLAGASIPREALRIELLPAPHRRPSRLPPGGQAVYAFFLGDRCLKVGKAGPKTNARFTSQHYGFNAPSTLAKSIDASRDLVARLLSEATGAKETPLPQRDRLGQWIERNTSRLNAFIPVSSGQFALALLEAFLQCRFKPVFEGKHE